MPIAEAALGAIFEALKLANNQLGSKLERELRDILQREKEGKEELKEAEAQQYPNYSDYAVKMAENKIKEAISDMEKWNNAFIGLLKPFLEAKK